MRETADGRRAPAGDEGGRRGRCAGPEEVVVTATARTADGGNQRTPERRAPSGHLQPFHWAVDRFAAAFGEDRVRPEISADGAQVTVAVEPGEGDPAPGPYTVILRDPVLGNANRQADPQAWLEAELRHARAWLEGKSRRKRSYG